METCQNVGLIFCGPSGSGKSMMAETWARSNGVPFIDADDLHPEDNLRKINSGIPLTDEDRWPWLDKVAAAIAGFTRANQSPVVACSSLRQAYRDRLRQTAPVRFVYLKVDQQMAFERIQHREAGHILPSSKHSKPFVDSQFEVLEEPQPSEAMLTVQADQSPETILEAVRAWLSADPWPDYTGSSVHCERLATIKHVYPVRSGAHATRITRLSPLGLTIILEPTGESRAKLDFLFSALHAIGHGFMPLCLRPHLTVQSIANRNSPVDGPVRKALIGAGKAAVTGCIDLPKITVELAFVRWGNSLGPGTEVSDGGIVAVPDWRSNESVIEFSRLIWDSFSGSFDAMGADVLPLEPPHSARRAWMTLGSVNEDFAIDNTCRRVFQELNKEIAERRRRERSDRFRIAFNTVSLVSFGLPSLAEAETLFTCELS